MDLGTKTRTTYLNAYPSPEADPLHAFQSPMRLFDHFGMGLRIPSVQVGPSGMPFPTHDEDNCVPAVNLCWVGAKAWYASFFHVLNYIKIQFQSLKWR